MLDALYQPFWIEGPIKVEHASSELAEAGDYLMLQGVSPTSDNPKVALA